MPLLQRRVGGVCAAALTPFNARLEPDHGVLVEHCRRLLANGCDAINLLGTTGEATSLSVGARIAVMEAIAASGLPLQRFMVGTGAAAYADAVTLTRAAVDLGFAGALVIPPFYFKAILDEGAFRYYQRLIERIADDRLQLYLYHFPQLSGFGFEPGLVARLAAAYPDTIAGIKDSSGVPGYAEAVVAACPGIDVFPSSEAGLADARQRGFAGCISATLNVTAPIAARVWHGEQRSAPTLARMRTAIAQHQLVPALRAIVAVLLANDDWLRIIPPLVEIDPLTAVRLIAELDRDPEFAAVRDAYTCA